MRKRGRKNAVAAVARTNATATINGDPTLKTVTSIATTAVGETVVLTGRIILNKDFGAGYSFPVMMEDAGITTE